MLENTNSFNVPNINSNNAITKEIIYEIDSKTFEKLKKDLQNEIFLCVCSGGTTSSCARDNFITLDLRKNYGNIFLNKITGIVSIGGGVVMGDLLNYLKKEHLFFPSGLSKLPGVGFILTGGVSPLSRKYGLAIDNLEYINGYLGNGKYISLNKNDLKGDENLIWRTIKGAAPFISVITEIGLKTFQSQPNLLIEGYVTEKELGELITISESFPSNQSLQWIYSEKIYIYIISEYENESEFELTVNLIKKLEKFKSLNHKFFKSFQEIDFFPRELDLFELNQFNFSEVISLLGEDLNDKVDEFIKELNQIIKEKPNKSCYVASQQLGKKTFEECTTGSLFVHRNSTWKPWIYTSWNKDDFREKYIALVWMKNSWEKLQRFFPNIHLAQLHNHLTTHEEEILRAFGDKSQELKNLKNFCDPEGFLPPL